MSVSPIWTVWCDANPGGISDCQGWCQLTEVTAAEARQRSTGVGWKRIGSKDICPACQRGGRTVRHGVR
jgi:hypothetical protein